jgi:hypothetical protein
MADDSQIISPLFSSSNSLDRRFLYKVLELALDEARSMRDVQLSTIHIFLALIQVDGGCTQDALRSLGFLPKRVYDATRKMLKPGTARRDASIRPTGRCRKIVHTAEHNAIHACLSMVDERALAQAVLNLGEGLAHEILIELGIKPARFVNLILASNAHAPLELESSINADPDQGSVDAQVAIRSDSAAKDGAPAVSEQEHHLTKQANTTQLRPLTVSDLKPLAVDTVHSLSSEELPMPTTALIQQEYEILQRYQNTLGEFNQARSHAQTNRESKEQRAREVLKRTQENEQRELEQVRVVVTETENMCRKSDWWTNLSTVSPQSSVEIEENDSFQPSALSMANNARDNILSFLQRYESPEAAGTFLGLFRSPKIREAYRELLSARKKAEMKHKQETSSSEEELQRAVRQIQKEYDTEIQNIKHTFTSRWAVLRKSFASFSTTVKADFSGRDWDDIQWQHWTPPKSSSSTVRIGTLTVQGQDQFPGIPAFVACPGLQNVLFKTSGYNNRAVQAIQSLVLRLLVTQPPGMIRFILVDPVDLGQNVASFMHLADYDKALITEKAWTEPGNIQQQLYVLSAHIENII